MRRVIVESPYAGNADEIERNVRYARAACASCIARGEAPWASHLLYTQPGILRDEVPRERELGIEAGLAWGSVADVTAVYLDLGVSRGMELGIRRAVREGRPVELRALSAFDLERALGPSAMRALVGRGLVAKSHAVAQRAIADERRRCTP